MTVCARCAATADDHPNGYCPDVVDEFGNPEEENETRVFQPAANGEWDPDEGSLDEVVGETAVVPVTGEVIDLRNPVEVARALADVEAIEVRAKEAKRLLNDALVRYSQEVAVARTFEIPGVGKFERTGGPKVEYHDPAALKRELIAEGMPPERANEIVVETVDRKVNGTEANKAARSNERFAEIIERAKRKVEAPYRVTRKG